MIPWLVSAAMAGNLYINGTFVDPKSVSGVNLDKVNVRFDESGNIWVDAPGYKIEVVQPAGPAPLPPGPNAATLPRPGTPPVSGVPGAVAPARWWLVTEDNGSSGHTIEVWVNGQLAQTVRSGEPQKIVDIGRWLRIGPNQVTVKSSSVSPTGGSFYVYLGTGSDQSGTVVMDNPSVQFGAGASRSGPFQREYTLNVDR